MILQICFPLNVCNITNQPTSNTACLEVHRLEGGTGSVEFYDERTDNFALFRGYREILRFVVLEFKCDGKGLIHVKLRTVKGNIKKNIN